MGEFAIVEGKTRLKVRRASPQTITDDQIEAFFESLTETCNVVRLPASHARSDYRLRGNYLLEIDEALKAAFRKVSRKHRRVGDLLLMAVAEDQLHLGVLTGDGFVHADARLRRVVETPGDPDWPIIGIYRRRQRRLEK